MLQAIRDGHPCVSRVSFRQVQKEMAPQMAAAADYIKKFGPEAFEKAMSLAAGKEAVKAS